MIYKTIVRGLLAAALTATTPAGTAMADVILNSYEITPGNTYQIIFVTSSGTTATSSNIGDYNAFVTAQAASSPSLPAASWYAVASTETVDANANAQAYASIPIYNTAGDLVASGSAQLWSGTLTTPVLFDQNGAVNDSNVWTGSWYFGAADPFFQMGAESQTGYGNSYPSDSNWLEDAQLSNSSTLPLYALSSPITVPVPESATLTLLGTALPGLGLVYLRRRRAKL